jgi:hypothetical protein
MHNASNSTQAQANTMHSTTAKAQRKQHCDGTRKRRHSNNTAKARYYAQHRAARFARRFGAL